MEKEEKKAGGGGEENVKAALARLASSENLNSSYDLVLGLVRRQPQPPPPQPPPPNFMVTFTRQIQTFS